MDFVKTFVLNTRRGLTHAQGRSPHSHHCMQRSSALGTTQQIILTGFVSGSFLFCISVVCDWVVFYKYQTDLWSGCSDCSVCNGKTEKGCLKLIIFLTLLSACWTRNTVISVPIFRGSRRALWLWHSQTQAHCSASAELCFCPLLISFQVTFARKYILLPVL